jgi:hypothetical protein
VELQVKAVHLRALWILIDQLVELHTVEEEVGREVRRGVDLDVRALPPRRPDQNLWPSESARALRDLNNSQKWD